ncbi:MAG: glutathione S-transferase family protein [Myxococcota bacterium]
MTQVTIHGLPPSSYTRSVLMTCLEKGIEYTLEVPDLLGPGYDTLHPFRKVPVLEHGRVRLFETSAIVRYLDEVFDGVSLTPSTPAEKAEMEKWISVVNCYLYPPAVPEHILQFVFPRGRGGKPDRARIDAATPKIVQVTNLLNARLEGREFLAGFELSLADLMVVPIIFTLSTMPTADATLNDVPHLMRWLASLSERESFKAVQG